MAQLVEVLLYKLKGSGLDSSWGLWTSSLTGSFRPHNVRGVDSASNRNEYQEYLLGWVRKGSRCLGLTSLLPSYVNCL